MSLEEAERGKCPECRQLVILLRDGTLRRHPGSTEFDTATDGVCSGSYALPVEDQPMSHTTFDQLLADLHSTAQEGGIGYWSFTRSYHIWNNGNCDEGEDVLGFYSDITETGDGDERNEFHLDREVLARGYRLACQGKWRADIAWSTAPPPLPHDVEGIEDWDYDAGDADCIVQLGLFGDVRYG